MEIPNGPFVQNLQFKHSKNEQHHWLLHIRISLGITFQLKLKILIFWTKFSQKGCFRFKTGKVNTTIEFWILYIRIFVPNFSLNYSFNFVHQIYSKRIFPIKSKKSEHHEWILHIRIRVRTKFQFKLTILYS